MTLPAGHRRDATIAVAPVFCSLARMLAGPAAERPARPLPAASILLSVGALLALALAAYHNSFAGAFVLDDIGAIVENGSIRRLWPPAAVLTPPADAGVGGRPLANLTFAVNYAMSGLEPWSYHVFNVLLHALTGIALFGVMKRTLQLSALAKRQRSTPTLIAFVGAALWMSHPANSAVVDYVSQRTEGLAALSILTTVYATIRAAENPAARRWVVIATLACGAGMAAKEIVVTAPLLVLLYDRAFLAGTIREALRSRKQLYAALATTWLLLGVLVVTSNLADRGVGVGLGVGALEYARAQAVALTRYAALAFWPHPLVFDYGWAYPRDWVSVAARAAAVVAFATVALWAAWRYPKPGFCAAAILLLLVPTSSVVPIVQQPVAESRMYLPVAVVSTGLVVALATVLGRRGVILAGLCVIPAFVGLTIRRNADYATSTRLWVDTIAKRPDNARAHGSLGAALLAAGDTSAAIPVLERALELRPSYPEAHHNLGVALLRTNRPAEAMRHFEAALAAQPAFADTHYNLAEAWHALGRPDEALRHLEAAIGIAPRHARAHNNLSVILLTRGDVAVAIRHAETAVQLAPGFADAHYNLANALVQAGRTPEAVAHYRSALRVNPRFARAANNLGVLALRAGKRDEAQAHFEAAVRMDPDYAEGRQNLERVRASR